MADGAAAGGNEPAVDDVVTCFLRNRGEVLLVRRSGQVGSYRGRWGAVSGFAEGDPLEGAWREIAEETGLEGAVRLVKQGEPFRFDDPDEGRRWRVHPFLFDAASRDAQLDWEAEEGVWVSPVEILTRPTVPRLWTSYRRAGPSLRDVREDREHGSAWLSLRAVEALRDRAAALAAGEGTEDDAAEAEGEQVEDEAGGRGGVADGRGAPPAAATPPGDDREALGRLARDLADARPAMTAVRNRVDRAMAHALDAAGPAGAGDGSARRLAQAVRDAAEAALRRALASEEAVADAVGRAASGRRVLTVSLSGSVEGGLLAASPPPERVVACESRPGGEGRSLAGRLAGAGIETVLVPDAAVAWALDAEAVEVLLVGADTVLEDGSVVNKVGTRPAALAARAAGVRVLAAASVDKIAPSGAAWSHADGERAGAGSSGAGSGGAGRGDRPAGASARGSDAPSATAPRSRSPLFERTPASLVDAVLTERGELTPEQVRAVAAEHAADRRWREA